MLSYKRVGLLFLTIGIILLLITLLRDILIPFFLAISLAYLFHPMVGFFEKKKFSRTVAIIVVYLMLIVFSIFFIFGIFPVIYRDMNKLILELPNIFSDIEKNIDGFNSIMYRNSLPNGMKSLITDSIIKMESRLLNELKALLSMVLSMIAYLPLLILTPFLAFYFLNDSKEFALKFIRLFPEKHHRKITAFIYDLNTTLMHYIRGQIAVGLVIGLITTIALFILKMPLALFLGVFTGITELIPFFGPFLSGLVIVFFALTISKEKALLAFAVFVIIQQLEANLITPKILGESVGMHPITIIFLILLGGKYFGIMGMFFVVPIFAVLKIILIHAIPFTQSWNSN